MLAGRLHTHLEAVKGPWVRMKGKARALGGTPRGLVLISYRPLSRREPWGKEEPGEGGKENTLLHKIYLIFGGFNKALVLASSRIKRGKWGFGNGSHLHRHSGYLQGA